MKVLIVEDEYGAAKNLCDLLREIEPYIEILTITETIEETVHWLKKNPKPEIAFFDIQLSDGNSFEIFDRIKIDTPIIFTTAFDEYALEAFKVNSIDYLLKPIEKTALKAAIFKYKSYFKDNKPFNSHNLLKLIEDMRKHESKKYKKAFLIHHQNKMIPLKVEDIAYFYLKHGIVNAITHEKKKFTVEGSLEYIESELKPEDFFRANRQYIVSRESIKAAEVYFQRKLKLKLSPVTEDNVLISKTKVTEFKKWFEA